MKERVVWISIFSVLLLTGCPSTIVVPVAQTETQSRHPGEGAQVILGPLQLTGELKAESGTIIDYCYLDIRNPLERSVTVELAGPSRFEMTIQDNSVKRFTIPAGQYAVKAIAAALGPAHANITVSNGWVYRIEISSNKPAEH